VTARFPLVDLDGYTGAGHRAIVLDDLERAVAVDVLRAWRVKGDDAELMQVLGPLNIGGFYHALSVAVLGSYIGNFAGGDPSRAPEFSLRDAEESDPKAGKLHRILEQYAEALTPVERDLLARLALFPRGVKVEILGWIVQSGGDVAGALIGLKDQQLISLLERLRMLGLVFGYKAGEQIVYSAHPFLREFFRNLLGTKPESVHESVRAKLAPGLEARPGTLPSDPAILDQYELLIEQTLLAGRVQEAFDLYLNGLGGYRNLRTMGEYGRGLRILERFLPQDDFSRIEPYLPMHRQAIVVNDLGMFAKNLGDLARARRALARAQRLQADSQGAQNLADVEVYGGRFRQALAYSESAVSLAAEAETHTKSSLAYRGTSHFALGDITAAAADFQRVTELEGQLLYALPGVWEAECKLLRGDQPGALSQTQANREKAVSYKWNDDLCRCDALLARLLLRDAPARAGRHLEDARAFANRSGAAQFQLRCFHSACELNLHLADYPQAIAEAEAGILLADTCGFGKYSIELRLALAETLLAAGEDARRALQNAREALDRSEQPDCAYAWGQADGLHFCGLAHLRLGERELARQRLTAALELRERLGHGRIEETRRALDLCRP
jgi:tetratricopeptide (TPR) repeat protein